MTHNASITIRMPQAEKTHLENAAGNLGVPMSDLVRDSVNCYIQTIVSGTIDKIIDRCKPIIEQQFPDGFKPGDDVVELMNRIYGKLNYRAMENLLLLDDAAFANIVNAKIHVYKVGRKSA
jgi:hypothetical protein